MRTSTKTNWILGLKELSSQYLKGSPQQATLNKLARQASVSNILIETAAKEGILEPVQGTIPLEFQFTTDLSLSENSKTLNDLILIATRAYLDVQAKKKLKRLQQKAGVDSKSLMNTRPLLNVSEQDLIDELKKRGTYEIFKVERTQV